MAASDHLWPATRQVRRGPRDLKVSRRAANENATAELTGHAIVYELWTNLYVGRYLTVKEKIVRGAASRALREGHDVRCLWNHDENIVLGRTASGTLRLREDSVGLAVECDVASGPLIDGMVLTPIDRQDVSGMSFAFVLPRNGKLTTTENTDGSVVYESEFHKVTVRQDGDKIIEEHEIKDFDLLDVSPVTYPAYDGTDVSMRSSWRMDGFAARDFPVKRATPRRDELERLLRIRGGTG